MEAGRLRLFHLDESGLSPPLPTGHSWCLPRQRKRVKYECPQGRRVNALASYEPSARSLDALPFERALTRDDLLAYLPDRLPGADVPRVVVLDNAGIHTSKHHDMPVRSFTSKADVRAGLEAYRRLLPKGDEQLRPTA